ncbi:hypothetical protein E5676_scaffold832G00480 [Cucumis melo var. makuwa]|uniref:Uncharacterized protein n=1 Tax=Cucumis melo var. makuwa TaxID=1194695 RepID=A0A5A7T182_CUCMM|nr:hypothetical protein E6C27_scaffold379G001250 [Cucumis melo var. makuwa]TYK13861.1 hypothetical protein E5676_scaffold832G00480 [Cucumis melo var. makuwa]
MIATEDDEFDSIEEVSEGKEELQLNLRPERLKGKQCALELSPASSTKSLNEDSPPGCASKKEKWCMLMGSCSEVGRLIIGESPWLNYVSAH